MLLMPSSYYPYIFFFFFPPFLSCFLLWKKNNEKYIHNHMYIKHMQQLQAASGAGPSNGGAGSTPFPAQFQPGTAGPGLYTEPVYACPAPLGLGASKNRTAPPPPPRSPPPPMTSSIPSRKSSHDMSIYGTLPRRPPRPVFFGPSKQL